MARLYETVLSVPGMDEPKKLVAQPKRKVVLILSQVINAALEKKDENGMDLLSFVPAEAVELKKLADDYLEQTGLTELAEKLKKFPVK